VLGTVDYIAPEQALNSHAVDIRADIYSLGATLYSLVTGKPPFEGRTMSQKLMAHQMKESPLLHTVRPEVPPELSAVVATMMAKKPEDRYQDPAEVLAALAPWEDKGAKHLSTMNLRHTATIRRQRATLASRRRARQLQLGAAAAVAAVLLLGAAWWLLGGGGRAPAVAAPAERAADLSSVPAGWKKSAAAVLYRLDPQNLKPFVIRMEGPKANLIGGKFPAPWLGDVEKEESVGEVVAEPVLGAVAMGCRTLDGPPSARLFATDPLAQFTGGHSYLITIEYLTLAQGEGLCSLRGKGGKGQDFRLPPTQGTWRTWEMLVEPKQDDAVSFSVRNTTLGVEHTLYVKSLEVAEVKRRPNFALELGQQQPFAYQFKNRKPSAKSGPGDYPAGWGGGTFQDVTEADVVAESVNGSLALGMRNRAGLASVQLLAWTNFRKQDAAGRYLLSMEYLTTDKGRGQFRCDHRVGKQTVQSPVLYPLDPTNGEWRPFMATFEVPSCTGVQLVLQNLAEGPSHALYVRSLEVSEIAEAPAR
jgi:hypothetical protein